MSVDKTRFQFVGITALLFAALGCRAAVQLVVPDTPTPLPTATGTPTSTATPLPTFTPTVIFEAACTPLLAEILDTDSTELFLETERAVPNLREKGSVFLITYEVAGDNIRRPHVEPVPDGLKDERDDRVTHQAIWDYFVSIIPPEDRELVSEFSIFTDGKGNHLATVGPSVADPERWELQVDILDADSYDDLTYTLIHEQGHLLTLNAGQVIPSKAIFKFPGNKTVYQQEADACQQYFTGEGCSQPNSYVNQFFTRFWPYLYADWKQIDLEEDESTRLTMMDDFYKIYQDQFLSDYAATSPVEDIAESWAFFVLSPRPDLTSIATEKILFFYEYPELVELRTRILKNICMEFPQ